MADEVIKTEQEQKGKNCYSADFLMARHAVYQNFIAYNGPIRETDLTPHQVYLIIYDVGRYLGKRNVPGLITVPTAEDLFYEENFYGGEIRKVDEND